MINAIEKSYDWNNQSLAASFNQIKSMTAIWFSSWIVSLFPRALLFCSSPKAKRKWGGGGNLAIFQLVSTFCLLFVYFLSTFYLLFVYFLSTFCLLFVYFLSTFCLLFIYFLSTFCLLFVYFLSTFCLLFVYFLSIYFLSTFCLLFVLFFALDGSFVCCTDPFTCDSSLSVCLSSPSINLFTSCSALSIGRRPAGGCKSRWKKPGDAAEHFFCV